jgi:glycerophosphoryl diester phosphodiesterase
LNNSNVYPFFSGPKPRVIGHRGAAGEAPENTLISFARAIEDGATIVELDVRANRDGEAVILHDAGLRRTTNGRGRVRRRRLEDLKALDAGYRFTPNGGASYPYRGRKIEIPTLEEFFSACPNVRSIVEIKPSRLSIVKQVV